MRLKNINALNIAGGLLLSVLSIPDAAAQSVSSPGVEKGAFSIENKGNYHWNDGSGSDGGKNKTEFEYGVTDWMKVAIAAEIEDEEGDDLTYEATEFEATFELTDGVEDPYIDVGVKAAYVLSGTGGPDKVEAKLLLRKDYAQWTHKANLYVEREVGDGNADGVETGLAWGTYYDMGDFELGGEYYADFGSTEDNNSYSEQGHRIGPVIGFDIPVGGYEVEAKLGYLQGISRAADDATFKYELELEF